MTVFILKIIACAAMLIDHIGYCLGFMPLRIVGRLAFPIFLYLIYNGYRHTSNPLRYAVRLGVFALISQVPFSLFCYNTLWSQNWNVFFTLLVVLLCIWATDRMRGHQSVKYFCMVPALLAFLLYLLGILRSDYGAMAIAMAMVFYWFDGRKVPVVVGYFIAVFCEPALSVLYALVSQIADPFSVVSQWDLLQVFSALALPLIFSYNGQKGTSGSKAFQLAFYGFYPAHLLVLWLLRVIL